MGTDERDVRIGKLNEMRRVGIEPYSDRYERNNTLLEAKALPIGTSGIRIAGRVMAIRKFGKLIFATLKDSSGKLQVALQEQHLDKEAFSNFKKYVDIGDFIGAAGTLFKTKVGEITLDVAQFELLSKTLRPLPEKWHGLQEQELLYRQRYLDLLMNEGSLEKFVKRTRIIKTMKDYLDDHGFLEVETPVLQTKPSGAIATPFVTHHNALNLDLYLRIAPETHLKRCIAGGFERVYEFARSFRNEGIDPSHLQDFTILEYYVAYWNYEDNMKFTEEFIKHVLKELNGSLKLDYGETVIDFGGEWEVVGIQKLILRDTDIDLEKASDAKKLKDEIKKKNIDIDGIEQMGFGSLVDNLFKKVSRPKIKDPLFLIHHPIELSPLARRNDRNPNITDRFQLIVGGWEIVNAYSELVDPLDQKARFEEQAELKKSGDTQTMPMDDEFLTAMEYGMPPMSGWGMGVDRFVCLLTKQENLRDIILFPLMKSSQK